MHRFSLREGVPEDAGKIATLHAAAWSEAFAHTFACVPLEIAAQKWRDLLIEVDHRIVLAEIDDRCIAFAAARMASDLCEITDFFVDAEHRRMGIAKAMLSRLMPTNDAPLVTTLWVAETNQPAIALYKQFGFQGTGRTKLEPRRIDSAKMLEMRWQAVTQPK